jgi:hypothetical protein
MLPKFLYELQEENRMIKMLFAVPVIMGCALAGTVGMIKAIKHFCPDQFEKNEDGRENK